MDQDARGNLFYEDISSGTYGSPLAPPPPTVGV